MTDILNALEAYESAAQRNGTLQSERTEAFNLYLGKPLGNEVEGRSQVVSHDVADTIEWMKPALLRTFTSGNEVMQFTPTAEDDVEAAEQETDYTNYVVMQKNNWFTTLYTWITDALIQKNAYVKAWWDTKEDITKEPYKSLSDDQFALIAQDPEVEIIEHSEKPDDYAMQQIQGQIQQFQQRAQHILSQVPPEQQAQVQMQLQQEIQQLASQKPMLHDCVVQKKRSYACVRYAPLPPERCYVYNRYQHVDLEDCPFFEHWEEKTISDLRLEGYKVKDDIASDIEGAIHEQEEQARNIYNDSLGMDNETLDPASKIVRVREAWLRFDEDKDGIAELRHVVVVGKTILLNEEAQQIPVACITPYIMPHRHVGRSVTDAVRDLQMIKSALQRGFLDNVYLANNGRYAIDKNRTNLDDMLTSRPGGVVRVDGDPSGAITPLVHQANFSPVLQAMEYFDTVKQARSGVTSYNQGLDADSLNKTAHGISAIMSAAQQRIDLIARVIAETGVKRLFSIVHSLTLQHGEKQEVVRLRNKWVTVDPRQWKKRYDMTISVGLGSSDKQQMITQLTGLYAMQKEQLMTGISKPQTIHHTLVKLTQEMGYKDVGAFWVDPGPKPFQPPPDPAIAKNETDAKLRVAEIQSHAEQFHAKLASEERIAMATLRVKMHEIQKPQTAEQPNPLQEQADLGLTYAQIDKTVADAEKARKDAQIAEVNAVVGADKTQAETQAIKTKPVEPQGNDVKEHISLVKDAIAEMGKAMSAPRKVVRGPDGEMTIKTVQ